MSWMKRPRRGRRARRKEKRLARFKAAQKASLRFKRVILGIYGQWMPHWVRERNARLWNQIPTFPTAFKPRRWNIAPEDEWTAYLMDMHAKRKLDEVTMPQAYWATDRRGRRKKIPLRQKTQKWLSNNDLGRCALGLRRSHSMPNLIIGNPIKASKCEEIRSADTSFDNESGYWSDEVLMNFKKNLNFIRRSYLQINKIGSKNERYEFNDYYEGRYNCLRDKDESDVWEELDEAEKKLCSSLSLDNRSW